MTTKHKSLRTTINIVEELVVYIFQITNNDKQFPKAYRYTLIDTLRNAALTLYTGTFVASSKHTRNSEDARKLLGILNQSYNTIIELNALLCISVKLANIKNPDHLFTLYSAVSDSYIKWIKSIKRVYGRMLEFERKKTQERRSDCIYDNDGFIVLKRRHPC